MLCHVYYRKKRFVRFIQSIRVSLRNVAGETKEEGLGCELQCPNAHLFYASLTCGSVFEDVAGKGIVHLLRHFLHQPAVVEGPAPIELTNSLHNPAVYWDEGATRVHVSYDRSYERV